MKLLIAFAALAALIVPAGVVSASSIQTGVPTWKVCETADCMSLVEARAAQSPAPTGRLVTSVPTWIVCEAADCASLFQAHSAGVGAPLVFCMSLDCFPTGVAYRALKAAGYDMYEPVVVPSPEQVRVVFVPKVCGVECLPVPEFEPVRVVFVPKVCGTECAPVPSVEDLRLLLVPDLPCQGAECDPSHVVLRFVASQDVFSL